MNSHRAVVGHTVVRPRVIRSRVIRSGVPLIAATVAAGALVLSGCGNGLETTAAGTDPSAAVASGTSSATAAATPSTSSSAPARPAPSTARTSDRPAPATLRPSQPTAQGITRCTVATLQVGIRAAEGGGAAGSNYVLLTYRNTGTGSCLLAGFPGVSFVGHGNGTQLGDPAVRNRSAASSPVRLAAGSTTTSLLQITNAGNYDARQCAPTTADGFRVYPPGSRAAVYIHFPVSACQRNTTGSPQLYVSPVGTSG